MVKVNTFLPLKFNDCDLKMRHIKQFVSLSTPVRPLLFPCVLLWFLSETIILGNSVQRWLFTT